MTTFPEVREALKACADAADMPRGDVYQGIERLRAQRDAHETACEVSLHATPAMLAHIDAQAAEIERLHVGIANSHMGIERLREALKNAAHAMGLLTRHAVCQDVHHGKADRHEFHEPCPVAARYVAAYDAARAALEQTN